jgi:hypothetical protein
VKMRLLLPFASPVKVTWNRVPLPLMAVEHAALTSTVARHVPPEQSPFTVHGLPPGLPPAHDRVGTRTHVPSGQSAAVKQKEPSELPPEHLKLGTTRQPVEPKVPRLTAVSCTTASLS